MSSSVRLCRVNPWEVPFAWEFVAPELERAIVFCDGESAMADIWKSLITGQHTLWIVFDDDAQDMLCCLTTFVHDYDKKRSLFIHLLAGRNASRFIEAEPELVSFAKSIGCSTISSLVIPRVAKRMQRVAPQYKTTHLLMVRTL